MGTIRISTDIAAGDAEVHRAFFEDHYLASDGTKELAKALADAANAVLRSYGIGEQLVVITEAAAALQRLRKVNLETVGELYHKGTKVGD